ncbi:MAG: hypothetical protein ABIR84_11520 [Candidatus Nitrotoga sp.]
MKCNRIKPKMQTLVEHVVTAQAKMNGHVLRMTGLKRALVKSRMMNQAITVVFGGVERSRYESVHLSGLFPSMVDTTAIA